MDENVWTDKHKILRLVMEELVFFSFSQYSISIFYYKRKWLLKGTDMIVKGKERQGCHKYITDFGSINIQREETVSQIKRKIWHSSKQQFG